MKALLRMEASPVIPDLCVWNGLLLPNRFVDAMTYQGFSEHPQPVDRLFLAEAAALAGVSELLFLEMVREGIMPAPVRVRAVEKAWWRSAILERLEEPRLAGPRAARSGRVYVVAFGPYVKIGYSTRVVGRITEIEAGTPERLTLHSVQDGDVKAERRLHGLFAERRLRGEWFSACPEVTAWIEAGCPIPDSPAPPSRKPREKPKPAPILSALQIAGLTDLTGDHPHGILMPEHGRLKTFRSLKTRGLARVHSVSLGAPANGFAITPKGQAVLHQCRDRLPLPRITVRAGE